MIIDRQQWIENLRQNPNDDTLRLVMADWLLENNEADRGKLIRMQLESNDEGEMENKIYNRLSKQIVEQFRPASFKFEIDRGFVNNVSIDAKLFRMVAKKLFAMEPVDEITMLSVDHTELIRLLAVPEMQKIRWLSFENCALKTDGLKILIENGRFDHLSTLELRNNGFTAGSTKVFRQMDLDRFPKLVNLGLGGSQLGKNGLLYLQDSPLIGRLNALFLHNCKMDSGSTSQFFRTAPLQHLQELDLEASTIENDVVTAIAESPYLQNLCYLNVSRCHVRSKALKILLQKDVLLNLRMLIVGSKEKLELMTMDNPKSVQFSWE